MKIPATLIREIYKERGNRGRPPSLRQIRAVEGYILANGDKTKAQVIREAGYPESRQNDTSKIFSRPILAVLDRLGITEGLASEVVKKNLKSKKIEHFTFPPYNKEAIKPDNGQEYRTAEKKGEQLTDQEIIVMMNEVNCTVKKIVHGDLVRHVYFWSPDSKTQLEAADMIFNLIGSYAPKKVEGKHDHRVGIFSMGELRKKMKEKGLKIINNN